MATESQIVFFEKNWADFEKDHVVVTASEGQETAYLPLNRSNRDGWMTDGSTDASATTYQVDFGDTVRLTDILLIGHNFKSYTIKYLEGINYTDFSTPISETTNSTDNNRHSFDEVFTQSVLLTINGTQTADEDKRMIQFIATELIIQLEAWPIVKSPTFDRKLIKRQTLSGKLNVVQARGGYSSNLSVENWRISGDLSAIEDLYNRDFGFLFWPSGGVESQFYTPVQGWRFEDIYLVRFINEFKPEWYKGIYPSGLKMEIQLAEVIT